MLDPIKQTTLVDIRGVCRSFPKGSGEELLVLEKVDLTIRSGEIVGLLGRSGSGKSTLLRIIAGLIRPSSGDATCRGETIVGPPNGVAMVFQSFALFPWLTVLQNVELGLEALGIDSTERRTRALAAISTASSRPIRRNCRAACASASDLRARWWCIRTSC
jgi:NitT/TauT family transport system ATP-binding protein